MMISRLFSASRGQFFLRSTVLLFSFIVVSLLFCLFFYDTLQATGSAYDITDGGGDCQQIGVWDSATKTCTLTSDLVVNDSNGIVIVNDGITLDGNGHSITGNGAAYTSGVALAMRHNIIVKNISISGFYYGMYFLSSSSSSVTSSSFQDNVNGIYFSNSTDVELKDNGFQNNQKQVAKLDAGGQVTSLTEDYHVPADTHFLGRETKSLTLENSKLKVLWNYEPYDAAGNQGGGNIFGLYDKQTDPAAANNMVSEEIYGGPGTSSPHGGIGGLGSTYMYDYSRYDQVNNKSGAPSSDNGGFARLEDSSLGLDSQGNLALTVKFVVYRNLSASGYYNGNVDPTNAYYRVTKVWAVTPDNQVDLDITTEILKAIKISEPSYGFTFSQDYGWTQASIIRHDFDDCDGAESNGFSNPANSRITYETSDPTILNQNGSLRHAQRFTLHGQSSGSPMELSINETSGGFEKTGSASLFDFGSSHWSGSVSETTAEYNNANGNLGRGNGIHFYGWWGGGNPQSGRYVDVTPTTYSDHFTIRLADSPLSLPQALRGQIKRLSTDSTGAEANNLSEKSAISSVGGFVAFSSTASNLTADSNSSKDVFRKNLETGATEMVSVKSDGSQSEGNSDSPAISADGRYVAFATDAGLVDGDTSYRDIYLRDIDSGQTVCLTCVANKNGSSDTPTIAVYDGNIYIGFSSSATNLVTGDVNGKVDIFLEVIPLSTLQTGNISVVSRTSGGTWSNAVSGTPSISANGRFVAFNSNASNFDAENNWDSDVFVKDMQNQQLIRISRNSALGEPVGSSLAPSISADGGYVSFSSSSELVAGDSTMYDIYVKNILDQQNGGLLPDGALSLVSADASGIRGDGNSITSSISGDGRFVSFQSVATNLVFDDGNTTQEIFVKDRQTNAIVRYPVEKDAWPGSGGSRNAVLSADGLYLSYASDARNLVTTSSENDPNHNWSYADSNNVTDIFRQSVLWP